MSNRKPEAEIRVYKYAAGAVHPRLVIRYRVPCRSPSADGRRQVTVLVDRPEACDPSPNRFPVDDYGDDNG